MEVHQHTHTPRKKWTHYFWEFLMLFLAVFCGFLAENKREHIIENQREKQFMQTFLDDLKKDTAEINEDASSWIKRINFIDSLRNELKKPEHSRDNSIMYRASASLLGYTSFRYNDRTIQQLRNSGNFRLINRIIADSMIQYDGTARTSIKDREIIVRDVYLDLIHLQNSIFDSEIIAQLRSEKNRDPLVYPSSIQNKVNLFQYYNDLYFYQLKLQDLRNRLLELHENAVNMMALIKQTYHLK